jgi:hypothetical protein
MALSKCVACNSRSFEVVVTTLPNYDYKVKFIQCAACGGVVGTETYFDAGILAKEIQKDLAALKQQVAEVNSRVASLR